MEILLNEQENVIIAELVGRFDTPAAPQAEKDLAPLLEKADRTLVLDCTRMSYISSSGLRIFLTIRKAAGNRGGKVIVRGISDDIRQIFMMTGFLNLFEMENG